MQAYLRSEQSRVLSLLKQWFHREAARQPFRVVATEKKLPDVAVGSLKLRLRADRVDELPDGGRLLLDYKTGEVRVSQWNGDRPDDPQLPLYAAYGGEVKLRGILFAQIRAGSVDFQGRVEDALTTLDASLGKQHRLLKDPYHPAMMKDWAVVLRDLAEEFLRGEAAVAPKRYPATCELCALGSLCRVRETRVPLIASVVDDEKVEKDQPGNGEASEPAAESEDD
jgi:ATP-dependent helicase/nuclease subunit B